MSFLTFQTYYGVDVNAITDPVRQKALKTMIETYGQTPQQLFTFPHSPRPQCQPLPSSSGEGSSLVSHSSHTFKFVDGELYGAFLLNRLSTSLSSDTGTLVGSAVDTLTGKFTGLTLSTVSCSGPPCINNQSIGSILPKNKNPLFAVSLTYFVFDIFCFIFTIMFYLAVILLILCLHILNLNLKLCLVT